MNKKMKKKLNLNVSHLPICRRRERGSHIQKSEVDIMTCESYNVVYLLRYEKCGEKYIVSTVGQLKHWLADHKGYITNQVTSRATGAHWNRPGHSWAHMKVTILDQIRNSDEEYCRERGKYFIRKFDTYNNGINREW